MARADVPRCQRPEEGPQRAVARCGPFLLSVPGLTVDALGDVVTPLSVVPRNGAEIDELISDKRASWQPMSAYWGRTDLLWSRPCR
jgi:hypothetical protein